jgi:hypothetical protein
MILSGLAVGSGIPRLLAAGIAVGRYSRKAPCLDSDLDFRAPDPAVWRLEQNHRARPSNRFAITGRFDRLHAEMQWAARERPFPVVRGGTSIHGHGCR